tara:strand:- start:82 stop:837 length:756 start_codon:yes stop_codon:yes gene_type:complete
MANKEFDGKVALITGASRGIGRAIAIKLAANGASIAINYNKNEKAAIETKKLVDNYQVPSFIIKANVADISDVKNMIKESEKHLGPIDLLVTNAGIAETEEVLDMSYKTWKEIMAINVDGTLLPILELLSGMIDRNYGRIVCISSIAGIGMRPQLVSYGTSKAAVMALVRNLAGAIAPQVRINSVAPGLIETDMIQVMSEEKRKKMIEDTPLKRIGKPEEIAETVLYLLSERSSYTTGQTLVSDGGRVPLP